MYGIWDDAFLQECNRSIGYLELYALVGTVLNWLSRFKNNRIILFCDNQSVMQMVNNTTSSCKNCMTLIRKLVLKSLCKNVRVFAKYIKSSDNTALDLLSRGRIQKFKMLKDSWDVQPTPVPAEIVDIRKMWLKD